MHEDDFPVLRAVLEFLAIAFSDRASAEGKMRSVEQLRNARVEPPRCYHLFQWKKTIMDVSCVPSTRLTCLRNADLAGLCMEI